MAASQGRPGGDPAFYFIVVADTHVNEDEHTSTSPYETNHRANARARYVFHEIAAMDPPPRFVIHLGDIVHPVPSLPTFHDAVNHFKGIAAPLSVPLHVIPGNHDVGDKTVDWMPADQVCDDYLATYRDAFGDDFFAFDEGGIRFILINSLLLNSGLADEERQRAWVEEQIGSAGRLRVFLFMHYPPYIYATDERGNYDNVDEPARTWLLEQMRRDGVEAVFAGHVHNFWYDRVGDAELYMLPSTAFLRHDFSEFGKTDPGYEFGRGDVAKFGYFRVDVHEDGHVAYAVRSHGRQCQVDDAPAVRPAPPRAHPKTAGFVNAGVELRHPWAEVMQITATGGVQEFGRKWARNDYPLLALWEMGVRLAKIPDVDLVEAEPRRRMALMAALGHRYLVTVIGAPRDRLIEAMTAELGVAGIEANLTLEAFEEKRDALRLARERSGTPIYFAKILTDSEAHFDGKTFSHFVKSGFSVDEAERHAALLRGAREQGQIDGITVRLEMDESLALAAPRLRALHERSGCDLLVSLKLAGASMAGIRDDDRETTARAAQALVLSRCGDGVRYVFDTFMDVDRGYFPRHAFIDRRFNPRPAAGAFTLLAHAFPGDGGFTLESCDESAIHFTAGGVAWTLLTGDAGTLGDLLDSRSADAPVLDLHAGARGTVAATRDDMTARPSERKVLLVRRS